MNTPNDFLEIKPMPDSGKYCVLDKLEGFEDAEEVSRGISQASHPPAHVRMSLTDASSDRTELPDLVKNTEGVMVISRRLKSFLESEKVSHVDYYPLLISNNDGKLLSNEHFIAHLIDPIDCIDIAASDVVWVNEGLKTQRILSMENLTLLKDKIPADRDMFRLRYFDEIIVARAEFAEALQKGGFSNLKIRPLPKSV